VMAPGEPSEQEQLDDTTTDSKIFQIGITNGTFYMVVSILRHKSIHCKFIMP
jgi:hypothetical protein